LCNSTLGVSPDCKLPHIDVRVAGAFQNLVGNSTASAGTAAFNLPLVAGGTTDKYWVIRSNKPSTTNLNGLQPGAISYDAASYPGDILVNTNRLLYWNQDQVMATSLPANETSKTLVETAVATEASQPSVVFATSGAVNIVPNAGLGNGGATMQNFPTQTVAKSATTIPQAAVATNNEVVEPAPPPKLIVEASRSVPRLAGVLNRAELEAVAQQVRKAREQLFEQALSELEQNPNAAELPDCAGDGVELCIAKPLVTNQADGYLPIVKRKVALLIGNNAYISPVPELETAVNDVRVIGETLNNNLGYDVQVIVNAGQQQIVDALNGLIRTTEKDDSVLVMYAGHGYLQEKNNTGYWIPSDASVTSADKWISNDTISRALGNIPAKQVMLVSDSCYSGTLTKEGKVVETVAIHRESTLTRRSVLALSSGADEPVSDEGQDNHSIFAWNMIQMLKNLGTETSGQQMHATLKDAVSKDFPQTPQYGTVLSAGHAEGGEYLFTPLVAGARP
jgi:uncharacterized caspase-like protein